MRTLIFAFSLTIIGCSSASLVSLQPNVSATQTPVFANVKSLTSDTNPRFLDGVLNNMQLSPTLLPRLNYNDRVAVMSIDRIAHTENDAQLVVERALIEKLLERNYFVVERDENILGRLKVESSRDNNELWKYYLHQKPDSLSDKKFLGDISFATKLLAYRILELGITEGQPTERNQVVRYGKAQIELSLIDASTSRILYSGIVEGFAQDTLSLDEYHAIAGLHYVFPSDALPLVLNLPTKSAISVQRPEQREVTSGVDFEFQEGEQDTRAYIATDSSSGFETVAKFDIPGAAGGGLFSYHWDLRNFDGNRVPAGQYALWLEGAWVRTFTVSAER